MTSRNKTKSKTPSRRIYSVKIKNREIYLYLKWAPDGGRPHAENFLVPSTSPSSPSSPLHWTERDLEKFFWFQVQSKQYGLSQFVWIWCPVLSNSFCCMTQFEITLNNYRYLRQHFLSWLPFITSWTSVPQLMDDRWCGNRCLAPRPVLFW